MPRVLQNQHVGALRNDPLGVTLGAPRSLPEGSRHRSGDGQQVLSLVRHPALAQRRNTRPLSGAPITPEDLPYGAADPKDHFRKGGRAEPYVASRTQPRLALLSSLVAFAPIALAVVVAVRRLRAVAPPYEDAAMLMRYIEHLAHGQGISWNPGHGTADGATDLLAVVLAAGIMAIAHVTVQLAVRILDLITVASVVGAVFWASWRPARSLVLSSFAVSWLLLGPLILYVQAGFVTPVFALFAVLAWLAARNAGGRRDFLSGIAFGGASVLLTLARPEGVFLSLSMLLGLLAVRDLSLRTLGGYMSIGVMCGGGFLLWRHMYFGEFVPNPFFIKGQGSLHFTGLMESLKGTVIMGAPFGLTFLVGLLDRDTRSDSLRILVSVACFASIWLLLSSATNYNYRFQYAVVPVMAVEWPYVANRLMQRPALKGLGAKPVLIVLAVGIMGVEYRHWTLPVFANGNMTVGQALADVPHRGQWMATTEAGLLPLYSGWNDIDTWGLNNDSIAHHGLSAAYLAEYRPVLIMFHTYHSPCAPWRPVVVGSKFAVSWDHMVTILHDYALAHGYALIAVFGTTPTNDDWFYVNPAASDAAAIDRAITSHPYYWGETGQLATNYAGSCPTSATSL